MSRNSITIRRDVLKNKLKRRTVAGLAERVDVTPRMIYYILNGERNPSKGLVSRLARATKTRIGDLVVG